LGCALAATPLYAKSELKLMRIISWNCNMAFRKKAHKIIDYNPDILIVPECESNDKIKFDMFSKSPNDSFWYGENKRKGLGVFSFSNYTIKLEEWHNPEFKTILPLSVKNGREEFILFAIWANNPEDKDFQYIGQIWKAINYYESYFKHDKILLVGDFNSNTIWDKPKREGNHSTVVNVLESKNIFSAYHKYYHLEQGKENHPTLFMYRHEDKPYHIDYCFASKYFINNLGNVNVGFYDDWKDYSDHMPLIVDFNMSRI